jgi:uncharacterized protein YdeI (YjbR/CyaY-like superfamily)
MPTAARDPRVDAIIGRAAPFARPILTEIRARVHAAAPDVSEDVKWQRPFFVVEGKLFAMMVAFKEHCSFGYWLGDAGGDRFRKLTGLDDLPPKAEMMKELRAAIARTRSGQTRTRQARAPRPEAEVPPDLAKALAKSKKAERAFAAFPPSHRREYAEWIVQAKRPETRVRRIAEAVAAIAVGRSRNWRYEAPKKATPKKPSAKKLAPAPRRARE